MAIPSSRAPEHGGGQTLTSVDGPEKRGGGIPAPAEPLPSPSADKHDETGDRGLASIAYPEPPRERLEWLLAASRVLFVGGALLAVIVDRNRPPQYPLIVQSLGIYLAYSLGILLLVWRPLGFGRGWAVVLHAFDLAAFSWLTLIVAGTSGTLLMSYVFLVICGTLRWQMWGALLTGAISVAALAAVAFLPNAVVGTSLVNADTFVTRGTQLAIMSALLGYLGAYHQRYQREIARLTAWPRRLTEDREELVSEIATECARILEAPRVLLVWEEPGDGHVNLAWMDEAGSVTADQQPEGSYESLVVPRLEQASFQAQNAADERGRVVYRVPGGFRQRVCRPINEALRARFDITTVQSWPLEGELIHGRLFSMGNPRIEIGTLTVGTLVARLAASRLDGLYTLRDMRNAAALRERVRVASDLHDSLLQSLAGVGLQLMVARRALERDPSRAIRQLEDIQKQIEQGEREMRAFIRRMRPQTALPSEMRTAGLSERLANLGRRVERQWSVKLDSRLVGPKEPWADGFSDEVFRIAREAILNAARHADASMVKATIDTTDSVVRLEISDDGGGFPFHGTYDLGALERMNEGPWSVKERVATLQGTLELTSTDIGSRLVITLPLPAKARDDRAD
jgi:signal transduction histidine kinase